MPTSDEPGQRGKWCAEHQRYECVSPCKDRTPCHSPRMVTGTEKCRMHLGKKAQPVIAEARIEQAARKLLYQHDAAPVADPLEALQRLAGRALALEETIGTLVNDLRSLRYETEAGGEQLRGEVAVLERAMDRAGRLLVDIAKLNIEERLAKVTMRQAQMAMDALAAAMAGMGMSADQQQEARRRVARHLRLVPAA
ncbi:MAG TPA: hypothetical protein VFB06_11320 [Streptosporangiaceae bacterium]|nr:hypothetical protein [Streptosporangiaceae bacterium]